MKARVFVGMILTSILFLTGLSQYLILQMEPQNKLLNYIVFAFLMSGIGGTFRLFGLYIINRNKILRLRKSNKNLLHGAYSFLVDRLVELRRPLQGLVGVHDLYSSPTVSKSKGAQFFEIADFCSRHIIRQLERLQFLSELELGQLRFESKIFSLKDTINKAIQIAKEQSQKEKVVICENYLASTPEFVFGNELFLQRIVAELIENSLRYTEDAKVEIMVLPDATHADCLQFIIRDNGPGLAEDKVKSLLMPATENKLIFAKYHSRLGIGHFIVKKLLNKLNGQIEVNSQTGGGTTISFSLPNSELRAAHRPAHIIELNKMSFDVLLEDKKPIDRQNVNKHSVSTKQDNVIKVNFRNDRNKQKHKETWYYIDFNGLFNAFEENLNTCRDVLIRASTEFMTDLEALSVALQNKNYPLCDQLLHKLHGELAMIRCSHGLEIITNMQAKIRSGANEIALKEDFENVSAYIENVCNEIDQLKTPDDENSAA